MRLIRWWYGMLATLVFLTAAAQEPASYRAGTEGFVSEMVRRHGFDQGELVTLMGQARYSQAVIDAIRRPFEAKPWYKYRPLFLTDRRIQGGAAFWRENRGSLERARVVYGVPPQIIAAIIGVETNYGGNLGRHRVIDALSTLGFSYPKRADFFRKELAALLLLSREESIDALGLRGSYAGAMGLPQFIPSSYRAYAVDFDGDGQRDLWESKADVIGSVGNYLEQHGWMATEPVAFPTRVTDGAPRGIAPAGKRPVKPSISLDRLKAAGIVVDDGHLPGSTRATLIRLHAPEPEYWVGLKNFYVITRYNHSNLYAMAVYQLSREIQATYEAGRKRQDFH
ncbi:lytic murein transglycosylase B [Candidatus Thiosymbion oneisti]|uniref:lytic murein transglycosylase B n=1 Tax=Candidatus Thiosymbion oneisti TaxID=589554 RepID=UPI000AA30916|nr:lytic murein transglycosylase B [Candidatus Thiosymbion oneisti]